MHKSHILNLLLKKRIVDFVKENILKVNIKAFSWQGQKFTFLPIYTGTISTDIYWYDICLLLTHTSTCKNQVY